MHLLVLSAFRRTIFDHGSSPSAVSMHLLVLSAFRPHCDYLSVNRILVSMHLLVLSAFRPDGRVHVLPAEDGLNAPFGAQCFPTLKNSSSKSWRKKSQCTFWCSVLSDNTHATNLRDDLDVSMHLLVLSAFRLNEAVFVVFNPMDVSQCTFWCSVLSDAATRGRVRTCVCVSQCTFWCSVLSDVGSKETITSNPVASQCTFWCSVLSDPTTKQTLFRRSAGLNAPFGAQCFPTEA